MRKMGTTLNPCKEIEPRTAEHWESINAITPYYYGSENTYYRDFFGIEYFCKNYPQQWGET